MNEIADAIAPASPHASSPLVVFLVRVARVLEERVDGSLGEIGLSAAKLAVLSHLVANDAPLPLGGLATRLSCVRSNVTQLIDRMEADGLVRRVDDPNDRRAVHAKLTDEGRERHREGVRRVAALEERLTEQLSDAERASLRALLSKLL